MSVTPLYNPIFYTAFNSSPVGNSEFVGYKIQNNSNTTADYWAQIGNFTGGVVSLASNEVPNHDLGTLNALTGTGYVYFFVTAAGLSSSTTGPQNHSLTIYSGSPTKGGSAVCTFTTNASQAGQGGFSKVRPTITAYANKVSSVTAPTAAGPVGSTFSLVASGKTGTIGAGPSASYDVNLNPITNSAWPAGSYQLTGVSITYASSATTFAHQLWLTNQSAFEGDYSATFTFTVVAEPSSAAAVSPIEQIASGTQMKHNRPGSFSPLYVYQSVAFAPFSAVPLTAGTFSLTGSAAATASSGLPVTYTTSTSSICTVSGTTVTLVTAGDCSLSASQAGNSTYEPVVATEVLPITGGSQLTVLYNANGATSGTVPTPGLYSSGATVTVASNSGSPALALTGSTFNGWNTESNGSGTEYSANSTFSMPTADVTLYAMWSKDQTITFNALAPALQGSGTLTLAATASSGLSVTYATSSSAAVCTISSDVVTIKDNSGHAAYCDITASQAGSTTYPFVNAAANVAQELVLLPAASYDVIYDPNGATSGTVPLDANAYNSTSGTTATVLGNTASPALALTGSTFYGWNTEPNGSGTEYAPGATFTVSADTVLYAMWSLNETIVFPSLGTTTYTTGSFSEPLAGASTSGLTVTFAATSGPCSITGSTLSVTGSGSCVVTASQAGSTTYPFVTAAAGVSQILTITAVTSATLTYDSDSTIYSSVSGSVPPSATLGAPSYSATVADNTGGLTLSGYTFYGWNTQVDGSGTTYLAGSTITLQGDTVLYAIWIQTQTNTFTVTSPVNESVGTVGLTGTASSGLPVYYTVPGPCTVSVSQLTLTGGGTCVITAHQDGISGAIAAAPSVQKSLTINVSTATVTYDANGGSGSVPIVSSPVDVGSSVTVLFSPAPTKTNDTFAGWSTSSSGPATYTASGTTTFTMPTTNVTLYAIYVAVSSDVISFNSESGTSVSSLSGLNGSTITLPGAPTYAGHTFLGWFLAPSGGSALKSSYVLAGSTTLYAQWSTNSSPQPSGGSGGGSTTTTTTTTVPITHPAPRAPIDLHPIIVTSATSTKDVISDTYQIPSPKSSSGGTPIYSISSSSASVCTVSGTGLVTFSGLAGTCHVLGASPTSGGTPGAPHSIQTIVVSPVALSGVMKSIVGSLQPKINQIVKIAQPISLSLPGGATVISITVNGKAVHVKIGPNGTFELPSLVGPKDKIVANVEVNGQIVHVPIATKNRPIALANVNFNFNSAALTPRAKFILHHVAQVVRQHGFTRVDLIGFTDVFTSPGFSNQRLSIQRAAAARSFINALLGKNRVSIAINGRAANDPLVKGRSAAARAVNRRVEIIVL